MYKLLFLLIIIGNVLLTGCSTSLQVSGTTSADGGADAYVQLDQPVPDEPAEAATDVEEEVAAVRDSHQPMAGLFAGKAKRMIGAIAKVPGRWATWKNDAVASAKRRGASTLEIVLMVFLVLAILALLDWLLPGLFGSLLNLIISALLIVLLVFLILWLMGRL